MGNGSTEFLQVAEKQAITFPPFEVNGLEPSAISGLWLSTDHNLFSVCYEGGHVVFYDTIKSSVSFQWQIEIPNQEERAQKPEITCMVAHNLEP